MMGCTMTTWPRDRYTGPEGAYTQDRAAGCIPDRAGVPQPAREVGCPRDPAEDYLPRQAAASTRAHVLLHIELISHHATR